MDTRHPDYRDNRVKKLEYSRRKKEERPKQSNDGSSNNDGSNKQDPEPGVDKSDK